VDSQWRGCGEGVEAASIPSPWRLRLACTALRCTGGTIWKEGEPLISLTTLHAGSAIAYVLAFGLPALDAVFPLVPAETTVIALGVATAGSADPRIALLVACAAAGAFAGDNLCYLLGRRFRPSVERRFFSSARGAGRRDRAEHSLQRYGMPVIIGCRFIPGGRTAVTLSCGLVGFPARRFAVATAVSGVIWASFAFFLGRLGGSAYEDNPWAGLLTAVAASIALGLVVEAVRRIRSRSGASAVVAVSAESLHGGRAGAGPLRDGAAGRAPGGVPV
jgi:membrane-associated protein